MTAIPSSFRVPSRNFFRSAFRGFPAVLPLLACLLLPAASARGATQDALQNAVNGSGTVSGTLVFGNALEAVRINSASTGKNLHSNISIGLPSRIGDLSALLLGQTRRQRNAAILALEALVQSRVGAFGLPGGLTTITGNGGTRTHTAPNPSNFENTRWLTINSGANGASLTNLHFTDVKVENTYNNATASGGVVNGLIGSAYNVGDVSTDSIAMGDLTDNEFSAISVILHGYRDDQYLAGGGILGLRSTTNSASIDNIVGNIFRGITVTTDESALSSATSHKGSAYIEGGGIIGVDAVSSPDTKSGSAFIKSLVNNLVTDVHVDSGDIILGGGLVGVNNNSRTRDALTYAQLLGASGNIFGNGEDGNISVKAGYSLRGGGVIGVNGLSDAQVRLNALTDNIFAGITVETGSYLRGGGIVGLNSNDGGDAKYGPITPEAVDSILENAIGNVFLNLRVDAGTLAPGNGGSLDGGGILGARSNMGMATISGVVGNIFKGLRVSASTSLSSPASAYNGHLDGGGIVGASSVDKASLLGVTGNYFDDLHVNVDQNLTGGGILGASAADAANVFSGTGRNHWAVITDVAGNSFSNLHVTVGGDLRGGGMIGVDNEAVNSALTPAGQPSSILEYLTGNAFTGIETTVAGDIAGGGVAGAHSGYSSDSNSPGVAGSLNISGNSFSGVAVSSRHLYGGGVIGFDAAGGASAYIETLSDNLFDRPVVATEGFISGGGVLGVRAESGISYIGSIVRNVFQGANITAGSYIDGGGLVGATSGTTVTPIPVSLIGIEEIRGSRFSGNTVTAKDGQIMGGAVYSYGLAVPMTISDSVFTDNTFTSLLDGTHTYNGGTIARKVYGTVTVDTGVPNPGLGAPHTLTLTATDGNSTVFRNNRIEDGSSPRYNSLYFGIVDSFTTDPSDPAQITMQTDNADADARLIVAPEAGGVVALYDPIEVNQNNGKTFDMYVRGAGEFLWGGGNNFVLDPSAPNGVVAFEPGSTTTLLSGMSLDATKHDLTLYSGGRINVMGSNRLNVNSAVLNGRLHFNLPGTTLNTPSTALLTINNPTSPVVNNANISGATVSLSNFAAGPALRAGDEFYLIATDEADPATHDGYLEGEPANNRATARQGLTREYEFIVDKNQTKALGANRYLVARLAGMRPAPEARILSEGRAASLAFLVHGASWLPDHSYQQADLAVQADDAWTPFGGVDGAYLRADSGSDIDISATNIIAGAAVKRTGDAASLLFGGFFDAGWASYDVSGDFGSSRQKRLDGDGTLRYYGLGLMSRLRWHKGFRLEGSLRAGFVENEFRSTDLVDTDGKYADYDITVPYVALHAGAGYEWQITEKSVIDILGRYYWTHQAGTSTTLDTGEDITFRPDNSHRLRAGARYTYTRDEDRHLSFYAGAAYEYEFDHKIHARNQDGHELDAPDMTGSTGIGEIGMIIRPHKNSNLTLECGLQAYTGMRSGVSGGIRLGLEF